MGKFIRNEDGEPKQHVSLTLTKTAWRSLEQAAKKLGLSPSEVIEHLAQSLEANPSLTPCLEIGNSEESAETSGAIAPFPFPPTHPEAERNAVTILERITDAFVALDHNWHYTYVNPAAAQILHTTPQDLLGKNLWQEVFPQEIDTVSYQQLHRAMAEQIPLSWEEFWQPIQGWLEIHAYPSTAGVTVYFRDITARKQAEAERQAIEQALRESELRLRSLFNSNLIGIIIGDLQGNILEVNDAWLNTVGYTREEVLSGSVNFLEITPLEYQHLDQHHREEMKALGYHTPFEKEYLRKDGTRVPVLVGASYLGGENELAIGFLIDLTERKRLESELQEQEQHFKLLVEHAPDIISRIDRQFRHLYVSPSIEKVTGISPQEFIGKTNADLGMPEEIYRVWYAALEQVFTSGQEQTIEFDFPTPDETRWYQSRLCPEFAPDGSVKAVFNIARDVTAYKQSEQTQYFLLESSQVLAASLDYQTTLKSLAQLVVPQLADWCTVHMVDEAGTLQFLAVAHADPTKVAWADELSRRYPPDPNAPIGLAQVIRTGRSELYPDISDELVVATAQDAEHLRLLRQLGLSSVMIVPLGFQGRTLGAIAFVMAESKRHYSSADLDLAEDLGRRAAIAVENARLYQIAQRDRAKAESANRLKDEFLAILSHELRSPLNPILGWTKLLRSGQVAPAKTEQALDTIERNAKLQAQLIEDLLDVSRILQGKMTLTMAPVNLGATIEAALETVRLAAEAKQISIATTFQALSGHVLGDTNRLQQILWNLLSNAVKFTPVGGQITIRLEQIESRGWQSQTWGVETRKAATGDQESHILSPESPIPYPQPLTPTKAYAQITVADTGIGISPEFLPYVFDYFRQEDGTTTRKFGGLGLGLAIVRHITELHGGLVQADSPGQNLGAIFTVQLPLNPVSSHLTSKGKGGNQTPHLGGVQVLVVDDDPDMRELAGFVLAQAGAQVQLAGSAAQALVLLQQSVPDLLLCDIGMPGMDGYALIQHIRQGTPAQGGQIPAIALTAYAGEINQQQALAAGFNLHLCKPIEPEDLLKAIAQVIRCTKEPLES